MIEGYLQLTIGKDLLNIFLTDTALILECTLPQYYIILYYGNEK